MTHTVSIRGYTAMPSQLQLGTVDSYGVEDLQLKFDDIWAGLAVTATFTAPNGTSTDKVVGMDGTVEVPHEATCNGAGQGVIVLRGCRDGLQIISCNIHFFTKEHGPVNGMEAVDPTPDKWQQFVDEVQDDREAANKAAQNAAASADRAEVAAENAENAAQTAADAAGVAGQSAGEAAQSAEAAETAKQRAEDASKKALEAKTGSENALQDADAAKDAASGYADAAAEKATAAAASEKNAARSENSAADSAAAAKKSADDANNTANSIKDSMTQIAANKEAVSQLKEDTAALQKRQNVLVGSETGNPVSCNDAYSAPLCGLTVYGKSTQDGTPTPDAPVPIVNAGDGGSVAVKVTGKNLYHAAWTGNYSESGLLLTATSTTIAIKGTATEDVFITQWLVQQNNPIPLDPNKRYTLTPKITANVFEGVMTYTYDEEGVGTYTGSNIPARSTGASFYYQKKFKKDETIDFETSIQLEIGTDATEYEPYHEQLLALPTPNSLPGIPVTSDGNYTDQNGQQWVCDEVDLERGVKVQRVDKTAFDSTKTLAEQNAILSTPIETPLTPAEIAAYKALTAYAPDTVVQASDGAGIKLCYQRDVNLVVKNLEDAIASMTTT